MKFWGAFGNTNYVIFLPQIKKKLIVLEPFQVGIPTKQCNTYIKRQ